MDTLSDQPGRPFKSLVICGVGLIGGSIARAAKERELVEQITGLGRNAARLQEAVTKGVIDRYETDPAKAAADADLIVVCTPVDRIVELVAEMHARLPETGIITDAGSVKQSIVAGIAQRCGVNNRFVGSHPLAGSEKSGFEHSQSDLYENATVILTPDPCQGESMVNRVAEFWQCLGARVVRMTPEEHDRTLAATSHLPHLVASALAGTMTKSQLPYASTGFRDTTRIASGDPNLWKTIFQANREATLEAARSFQDKFAALVQAIEQNDSVRLENLLEDAKTLRDHWRKK